MASAGTFGQQLVISTGIANSVTVCGHTQNKPNGTVCQGWDTPNYSTWIAGWWWQGYVTIYYYYGSNQKVLDEPDILGAGVPALVRRFFTSHKKPAAKTAGSESDPAPSTQS